MRVIIKLIINSLMVVGSLFILSSCTIFGLGIGASMDKYHKRNDTIQASYINEINPGRKVELTCTDGKQIQGVYKGTRQIPQEEFAKNYFQFKKLHPDDLSIPDIGDTIEIYNTKTAGLNRGRFIALETNKVIIERLEFDKTYTAILDKENTVVYYDGMPFMTYKYKDLPRRNVIKIKHGEGEISEFQVHEIDYVLINYKYLAKMTGILIGVTIDMSILIFLISQISLEFGPSVVSSVF